MRTHSYGIAGAGSASAYAKAKACHLLFNARWSFRAFERQKSREAVYQLPPRLEAGNRAAGGFFQLGRNHSLEQCAQLVIMQWPSDSRSYHQLHLSCILSASWFHCLNNKATVQRFSCRSVTSYSVRNPVTILWRHSLFFAFCRAVGWHIITSAGHWMICQNNLIYYFTDYVMTYDYEVLSVIIILLHRFCDLNTE